MTTLMLTALALMASTPAIRCSPDPVDDKTEVAAVIREAVGNVMSVLQNTELSRLEKRKSVMRVVEPLIDFELLAMLSLGKTHWTRIDAEQRRAFTDLFVETLKLSYFEKLELFTDESVEFEEPIPLNTKGSPKFHVLTYIISKGDRVQVAYELSKRDGTWKAFDFEIEGVSVRKSYGSQYSDFLREKSFDQLLETMREKVREAKEKDSGSGSN